MRGEGRAGDLGCEIKAALPESTPLYVGDQSGAVGPVINFAKVNREIIFYVFWLVFATSMEYLSVSSEVLFLSPVWAPPSSPSPS